MPCLNGPPVHPLLDKFNQFLTLSRPFFKIYFNIVFLSKLASPKWPSSSVISHYDFVLNCHFLCTCCGSILYFECIRYLATFHSYFVVWILCTVILYLVGFASPFQFTEGRKRDWPFVWEPSSRPADPGGRSVAGIASSNPTHVCCDCYVLSGRGNFVRLITRPEVSYRVWCVWVWSWHGTEKSCLKRWQN